MPVETARRIPIYILAGGQSTRFGSDKARAVINGQPMILQVAQALEPAASRISIVAQSAGQFTDLGLRTIADKAPGHGPMGGLQAAIEDLDEGGWMLLAACDWIGLRAQWVEAFLQSATGDLECVYIDDGRPQPLFALYHHSALGMVERLLLEKRLSMQALIERLRGVALPPPNGWAEALNVNSRTQIDGGKNDLL